MSTYTPENRHEERLLNAWNIYAESRQHAERVMIAEDFHPVQRMAAHKRSVQAYQRFVEVFNEPTPRDMADESWKLSVEGLALFAVSVGIAAFYVPAIVPTPLGIAVSFFIGAGLGAWAFSFFGRLGHHLGRRM